MGHHLFYRWNFFKEKRSTVARWLGNSTDSLKGPDARVHESEFQTIDHYPVPHTITTRRKTTTIIIMMMMIPTITIGMIRCLYQN